MRVFILIPLPTYHNGTCDHEEGRLDVKMGRPTKREDCACINVKNGGLAVSCWECHKDALAFQEDHNMAYSCSGFSDSSPTCLHPTSIYSLLKFLVCQRILCIPLCPYLRGFGTSLAAIPMTLAGWLQGWLLVRISGSAI